MSISHFYSDGLHFECTGCGECCKIHGNHAYVYLTPKNISDIANSLGMTPDEFDETHCTQDEDGNVILTMIDRQCNFLRDNQCIVYDVRPAQCRAWPFLAEHLDEETWQVVREFCQGIGRGKLYTKEEIEAIVQFRDDAYGHTE